MSELQKLEKLVEQFIKQNIIKESSTKIDSSYTHFLLDKETNKILNGWNYSGEDSFAIAQHVNNDLKDMGVDKKTVSVLSVQKLKTMGIDPFDSSNWKTQGVKESSDGPLNTELDKHNMDINKLAMKKPGEDKLSMLVDKLLDGELNTNPSNLKKLKVALTSSNHPDKKAALELIDKKLKNMQEDTIVATTTGDTTSATPDQKKKIQIAAAKGDTVKVVKKGVTMTEEVDEINKQEDKESVEGETDTPRSPNKLSNDIEDGIKDALKALLDSSETSEDSKYKKYSNDVMKHLNKALEAFNKINAHETKLSEEAQIQDEKEGNKAVDTVQKHLAKKVRNKEDVPHIMKKYAGVVKKLKDRPTEKITDAVWKHVLKEGFSNKTEFETDIHRLKDSINKIHNLSIKHGFIKK